uniref:Lens protein 7 n=1 Tax=Thermonectus marmoratus TaxID=183381 RepID=A0A291S1G9_THEMR|nr:lens protein 7 [Thermonectus marmoratus]
MKTFVILFLVGCASATLRPRLDGRIVGGKPVSIEDFPYQLSLQYGRSHICGASIIAPNWVLTASHCVDGRVSSQMSFRAGSSFHAGGGTVHQAKTIIMHPNYNKNTYDYDYALVQVINPFEYETKVKPVELATENPRPGSRSTVTGWGTLTSGGSIPNQLQSVDVNIISHQNCESNYGPNKISERMICAANPGKDSCQGDSGGPLVDPITKKQIGVVSWGYGCADPNYPGVYASVANKDVRAWIKTVTEI